MSYILLHLFGQLIGSRLAVFSNLNNGLQSWSLPLVVMENASSPLSDVRLPCLCMKGDMCSIVASIDPPSNSRLSWFAENDRLSPRLCQSRHGMTVRSTVN